MNSINWNEAREDARRLTKITKRDVEAKPVTCDCDYSKNCFYCGGEGTYYEPVYSSCGHVVQDGDDIACIEGDCEHKSYLASIEREEQLEASHA